jgi:methylated-DNA-[protein]-cysteine S-methyltransferase
VQPIRISYRAPGWGTGELWLRDGAVLHHELPVPARAGSDDDHPLADLLRRHFAGEQVDLDAVAVDLDGESDFGLALAAALRAVPRGEVVTYGELAALAGRPGAARAAGTFCARNRASLFVPCHRVVASDGIGSYGSLGVEYKRRLLALERR